MHVDLFLGEVALVAFVVHFAERAEVESSSRDDGADPEFDEGRMFGVDTEIAPPDIGNACEDVVALVLGEAVEASGKGERTMAAARRVARRIQKRRGVMEHLPGDGVSPAEAAGWGRALLAITSGIEPCGP